MPAVWLSVTNFFSSASLGNRNVTFMIDRDAGSAWPR
jgi:hypothetical protein